MCEPTTLMVAAVGLSAISAGVSAYGAYTQQDAANKAAEYNAKVAERNKTIADMQAEQVKKQGEIDARNYKQQVSALKGSQRAGYAGSGVLVDAGTPFQVGEDTSVLGELDAMTIKRNAARQAWGYQVQGMNYASEGELSRLSKRSALLSGGTSLASGLANTFTTAAYLKKS